ncbi:hypothetical protein [Aliiroseovarius crassostreae]|uniref:hypothetical protein n=1 Tax=Aliiroseovarius crassostreae TaxID=154981 RepID=UPI00220082D1|nr:hypothetical protein [Aliiroseovarius crassostreae]UWQ06625.1 hypothetical protein K3X22_15155 [Aliiroseovarius crassostreae]
MISKRLQHQQVPRISSKTSVAGFSRNVLRGQGGFSYPIILGVLLVLAVAGQGVALRQSQEARRHLDQRVSAEGEAFVRALAFYWKLDPTNPTLPSRMDQLLNDSRMGQHRHLRRAPVSPFEDAEWELLRNAKGQIHGIFLASTRTPARKVSRQQTGQDVTLTAYNDWHFIFENPPSGE